MLILIGLACFITGFFFNSWVNRKPKRNVITLHTEPMKYKPLEELKVKAPRRRRTADENAIEAERKSRPNGHDKDPLPS